MRSLVALGTVVLALVAPPAFAQSYLARPLTIGGNPGPAHNYVCPNVEAGSALDCYLDAVRHLYTMCRHIKSLEILEHGYDKSEDGTNSAKTESCIAKQRNNIARPYQAALVEVKSSKPATVALKELHEFWLTSLALLKWHPGETDDDYKFRTGVIYVDFYERADTVREMAATQAAPDKRQVAGKKAPR
jgi:hypothetical protein